MKSLSEIFRTVAAYELFLRLSNEKNQLRTIAFESEFNNFLNCFLNKERGGLDARDKEESSS